MIWEKNYIDQSNVVGINHLIYSDSLHLSIHLSISPLFSDKLKLFQGCFSVLVPGGSFFIEDFVQLSPFVDEEKLELEVDIASPHVPTHQEYVDILTTSGFKGEMRGDN